MPPTAERLASLETLVTEIHAAVVGERLVARVAVVESELQGHRSAHRWSRARGIAMGAATTLATAVSAAIGLKVVVGA